MKPTLTPAARTRAIIREVADKHGVGYFEIIGGCRTAKVVAARFEAIERVKKAKPHLSTPHLGRIFGGRDHSTVLHALGRLARTRNHINAMTSGAAAE